jgi:hypothetical protein
LRTNVPRKVTTAGSYGKHADCDFGCLAADCNAISGVIAVMKMSLARTTAL